MGFIRNMIRDAAISGLEIISIVIIVGAIASWWNITP